MAYIRVNHSYFETAASAIESYVTKQNSKMNKIDKEVDAMASYWSGVDYQSLLAKWEDVNSNDSTSGKMKKALNNYAGTLRKVGNMYKEAQGKAVNRANNIPRW